MEPIPRWCAGFDILYGAQGNDVLYSKNGAIPFQRSDNRDARVFAMFSGSGPTLIRTADE